MSLFSQHAFPFSFRVHFISTSPSLCLFWVFLAFSVHFYLLLAALWLWQAETYRHHVHIRDSVRAWMCPRWLHSHLRNSCLHFWGLTGMLAGDNAQTATPQWSITPGWQRLPRRRVTTSLQPEPSCNILTDRILTCYSANCDCFEMQNCLFRSVFLFLPSTQTEAGCCMQRGTSPTAAGTTGHKYLKCHCSEQVGGGRAVNSHVASVVLRL